MFLHFFIYRIGRHEPIQVSSNNNSSIICFERIQAIFSNQKSSVFLDKLEKIVVNPLQDCCEQIVEQLNGDVQVICKETAEFYSIWKKERKFRITGSDPTYRLFTYIKNKNPDWEQKSFKYFYPTAINNSYTKHGLVNEPIARQLYENFIKFKVVECGLIVAHNNPWLGCSPDGIVFDNLKPIKVIEIKCPYNGKKKGLQEVISSLKYLVTENDQLTLKKQHPYYAQVQISMVLSNLLSADFIIYTPFDNGLLVLPISFDIKYAETLLHSLKEIYFNKMIHIICKHKDKPTQG